MGGPSFPSEDGRGPGDRGEHTADRAVRTPAREAKGRSHGGIAARRAESREGMIHFGGGLRRVAPRRIRSIRRCNGRGERRRGRSRVRPESRRCGPLLAADRRRRAGYSARPDLAPGGIRLFIPPSGHGHAPPARPRRRAAASSHRRAIRGDGRLGPASNRPPRSGRRRTNPLRSGLRRHRFPTVRPSRMARRP